MLAEMLSGLQQLGVHCATCSFNSRDRIETALSVTGLKGLFPAELIIGADEIAEDNPQISKANAIANLILAPLGCTADGLLFADDDPQNVHDVRSTMPLATTLLVPSPRRTLRALPRQQQPKGGLQRQHCEAVLEWARVTARVQASTLDSPEGGCTQSAELDRVPPLLWPPGAACPCFAPKQRNGPLARWCARCACGEHETTCNVSTAPHAK